MDINKLNGVKIGITAYELEQKEHRGISAVTKSLIKLLNKYGADVYIITGFHAKRNEIKNLILRKKKLQNEIAISDICHDLHHGANYREEFKSSNKNKIKLVFNLFIQIIFLFKNNFKLKYKVFELNENHKLINIFNPRMDYLNYVKGIISVKYIFHICRLRSIRLLLRTPELKINNLDLIISTSPLSIKSNKKYKPKIIQLIHDLIPIQVSSHPENPNIFYNRLKDSHKNNECIYVSKASKELAKDIVEIGKFGDSDSNIIYPLPSLNSDLLVKAINLNSIRNINRPFIVFNSSIEERKRVENALKFYMNSNLSERDILFCLAGKLHDTKYCNFIKSICKDNKNILLLDYVSDLEKAWLFLNSSLLVSTSTTEGFGIPVLDALSIDLPILASDIPSHYEIGQLKENSKIKLIRQNNEEIWVKNLNKIEIFPIDNIEKKQNRIASFNKFLSDIEKISISKFRKYIN